GDELRDMQLQREILVNLKAERASALLLSGGGNDLFDNGQLGRLVETPFPGATAEDLVGEKFNVFLRTLLGRFLAIFIRVHTALPHVHILVHGYGPAFPRGGDWIEKPLTKAGVPLEMQHDVVKVILKRFNAGLKQLATRSEFHGKIAHLDVTDIGTRRSDWHDEIHLNGPNASKVADRFRIELRLRLTGPVPETRMGAPAPVAHVIAQQAEALAAFDEATLLRELDARVSLVEMDPTVASEAQLAPLTVGEPAPEIGFSSIRKATRELMRNWEANLRDVLCGGQAGNQVEQAILDAIGKGKVGLSSAIASWLVTGPLAVPAVIASALAAWLSAKVLAMGRERICSLWQIEGDKVPAILRGAVETSRLTIGDLRDRFTTPDGEASFSKDDQKTRLDALEVTVARDAVDQSIVPVDADGAKKFSKSAAEVIKILGGEADDAPLNPDLADTAEAMIILDGTRPAIYIRDGFVDLDDEKVKTSGWLKQIKDNEADIRKCIAASGRIIRGPDRSANQVYGSAWMLQDGRVATARHVLEEIAIHSVGQWFLKDLFYVDFAVEADREINQNAVFRIASVDWAGPEEIAGTVNPTNVDAAILSLVPVDGRPFPEPIPLTATDDGDAVLGAKWFMNIGHPAQPWGPWLVDAEDGNDKTISKALVSALIGDKFGVKRLSPGRIDVPPGFFPGDQETKHVFTHDATTLGGSSGSGILSLTGIPSMCGLHFAGLFGTRNYAHFVPPIFETGG
ncbi:MAG: trypsin-like peptidase domain-containing protein, partial [Pseudomonadota bacterium]